MGAISAACPCGAVTLKLAHAPDFINDCNCSLCRRAAARWGYYDASEIRITGETLSYVREDRVSPAVEIHACKTCEMTTHWRLTETYQITADAPGSMGVNMRLFRDEDLNGVELRFPNGKSWTGEGPFSYRKPPVVL